MDPVQVVIQLVFNEVLKRFGPETAAQKMDRLISAELLAAIRTVRQAERAPVDDRGLWEDARRAFNKAVELHPKGIERGSALVGLAHCHSKLGDPVNARVAFEEILRIPCVPPLDAERGPEPSKASTDGATNPMSPLDAAYLVVALGVPLAPFATHAYKAYRQAKRRSRDRPLFELQARVRNLLADLRADQEPARNPPPADGVDSAGLTSATFSSLLAELIQVDERLDPAEAVLRAWVESATTAAPDALHEHQRLPVSQLDGAQRHRLLQDLAVVAACDGRADSREGRWLRRLALALGLDQGQADAYVEYAGAVAKRVAADPTGAAVALGLLRDQAGAGSPAGPNQAAADTLTGGSSRGEGSLDRVARALGIEVTA